MTAIQRLVLLASILLLACCGHNPTGPTIPPGDQTPPGPNPNPGPIPAPILDQFIATAGDIGLCGSKSGTRLTSELLDTIPGLFLASGDIAYPNGERVDFINCLQPFWGRHIGRMRVVPGNHEYADDKRSTADAFFNYFGEAAGEFGRGYFRIEHGAWQIYGINSNRPSGVLISQQAWLASELVAHPSKCALAFWHHPVVSSGINGGSDFMKPVWQLLAENHVDVVLNGHDHIYERFAPQDRELRNDPTGIRQFTVGTGGAEITPIMNVKPSSEVRIQSWGILKMTLRGNDYTWEFVPVAGGQSDSGTGVCH